MKATPIIMIVMFLSSWVWAQTASSNSLFRSSREQSRIKKMQGMAGNSTSNSGNSSVVGKYGQDSSAESNERVSVREASWLTLNQPVPKGFRMHDLLTIVVSEVSSNSTKAKASTDRSTSIDAKLEEWFRLTGQNIRPSSKKHGEPQLKLSVDRDFEGQGDVSRQDSLTAKIQAEVIDVMPNGNLTLEAVHTVTTDDEQTVITLTGICRGKDVSFDNQIRSSQLARLDIRKMHTGAARDATKRGWLVRFLDFLNPI